MLLKHSLELKLILILIRLHAQMSHELFVDWKVFKETAALQREASYNLTFSGITYLATF